MAAQRDSSDPLPPTKRGAKYCAEMAKLFQVMDRTPSSDWSSLSVTLTHVLRCFESHGDVAAEALPDPALLSRAVWKCLDAQGVMGVQRKALDLLHRLAEANGAAALLRQAPLLMASVLDLVPRCSMQLKCELLYFVKAHLVRALPREVVTVELPGLIEAVIGGIDESERSEIYRVSMSVMHAIHHVMETAIVKDSEGPSVVNQELGPDVTQNENIEDVLVKQEEQEQENQHVTEEVRGDVYVYRALWMTLRNSPSVRGAVLLYLRRLLPNTPHNVKNSNSDDVDALAFVSTPSQFTLAGGDLHLTHCAIFTTLQAPVERTQRLMLDVLIGGFPLCEASVFNVAQQSQLVAAAVQLLGLPGTQSSIRRRVADWLLGPSTDADTNTNIVRDVSSFRVAEAFRGVVRWWEAQASDTPVTADAEESSLICYDVLFASVCAHSAQNSLRDDGKRDINDVDLAKGEDESTLSIDLLPITWLRSLTHLFQFNGSTEEHDHHYNPHYQDYGNSNTVNNTSDESGGAATEDVGSSVALRSPFLEHIAPLAMPHVCELLVSMELRRRDMLTGDCNENHNNSNSCSNNSSSNFCMSSPIALDATLAKLFEVVPWFYFTQYQHDIVSFLCTAAAVRLEGAAHDTSASLELSKDVHQSLRQLNGMASILAAHVIGNSDNCKRQSPNSEADACTASVDQMVLFHREILCTCHSLCEAITVSCAAAAASPHVAASEVTKLLITGCLDAFNVIFFGTFPAPGVGGAEESLLLALLDAHVSLAAALSRSAACGDAFAAVAHTALALLARLAPRGGGGPPGGPAALRRWIGAIAAVAAGKEAEAGKEAGEEAEKAGEEAEKAGEEAEKEAGEEAEKEAGRAGGAGEEAEKAGEEEKAAGAGEAGEAEKEAAGAVGAGEEAVGAGAGKEAGKAAGAGEEAALRLYVEALRLNVLPDALGDFAHERQLTARLAPRLWRLLGRGGAEQTHRAADLLVQLYALPGGRDALDVASAEATSANGARLVLLFRVLAERDAPLDLFVPGLLTLLRALRPSGPLRSAAQALARHSIRAPERLLDPLAAKFSTGDVAPAEFARIVCDLAQAAGSAWLEQLARTPPPPALVRYADCESALAAVAHTLLDLAASGLRKQKGKEKRQDEQEDDLKGEGRKEAEEEQEEEEKGEHEGGEEEEEEECANCPDEDLCVEACETLNTLLGLCLRHPRPLSAALDVWRSVSVRAVPLLRDAVAHAHAPAQVLLLRYVLDAARPPGVLDEAVLDQTIEIVDAALDCAAEAALREEEDPHDLLAVWTTALLEIFALAVGESNAVGERFLLALLRRVDALLLKRAAESPPDAVAALSVVEKCIGTMYAVIDLLLLTLNSNNIAKNTSAEQDAPKNPNLQGGTNSTSSAAKRGGMVMSLFNFLSFSSSASSSADAADASLVADAAYKSMGLIVSTMCRAHGAARFVRQTALGDACVAAARVESAAHDILRLLAAADEHEFVRVYIGVWAAEHIGPLVGQADAESPVAASDFCGNLFSAAPFSDALPFRHRDEMAALLAVGAGVSALPLLRIVSHLLTQVRASGGSRGGLVNVPFDVMVFSFVYSFLRGARPSREESSAVLNALIGLVATHFTTGAASTLTFPIVLRTLADFEFSLSERPAQTIGTLSSPAAVSGGAAHEGKSESAGKDRRFALVICRTLEHFSSAALHLSGDVDGVLFALRALVAALPVLTAHAPAEFDRVASAALSFYRRALLPTILFCTDAATGAEVCARASFLCAALTALGEILFLGDAVRRRLRPELLEALFKNDFFRFSRGVVRAWRRVCARAAADRAFHAAAAQLFAPSRSPSSRLAAFMHLSEEEDDARQLRRMAFYAFCAPAQRLAADRAFALLLRERVAETFRAFPLAQSGGRRAPPNFSATRRALFLFRVLLVKWGAAAIRAFWPIVLPEVLRALATAPPSGADAANEKERMALHVECLKVLDFILVIAPETFASYRWIFFDDMRAERPPNVFVPFVARIADSKTPHETQTTDENTEAAKTEAGNTEAKRKSRWNGRQRPVLCASPAARGLRDCAAALAAFSRAARVTVSGDEEESETAETREKMMDGWDESYVCALLEREFLSMPGE